MEYEEPESALGALREAGIRINKLHLSAALIVRPNEATRARLKPFEEDVYLHQVVERLWTAA